MVATFDCDITTVGNRLVTSLCEVCDSLESLRSLVLSCVIARQDMEMGVEQCLVSLVG